jgi:hypothetical protein
MMMNWKNFSLVIFKVCWAAFMIKKNTSGTDLNNAQHCAYSANRQATFISVTIQTARRCGYRGKALMMK